MIRRLSTALAAAFALQLSILGMSVPCDMTHASHDSARVVHESAADHGAGHSAPESSPAQHSEICDTGTNCCGAPCSTVSIQATLTDVPEMRPDGHVGALVSHAPRSRITTPDPPPPKA